MSESKIIAPFQFGVIFGDSEAPHIVYNYIVSEDGLMEIYALKHMWDDEELSLLILERKDGKTYKEYVEFGDHNVLAEAVNQILKDNAERVFIIKAEYNVQIVYDLGRKEDMYVRCTKDGKFEQLVKSDIVLPN